MQLLARIVWRDSWSIYETAQYFVSGKGSKNAEQLGIRSHRGGETLAVMPIQTPTEFHGDWWQNGTQKDGEPGKRGGGAGKGSSRDDSSSSASSSSSSPSSPPHLSTSALQIQMPIPTTRQPPQPPQPQQSTSPLPTPPLQLQRWTTLRHRATRR